MAPDGHGIMAQFRQGALRTNTADTSSHPLVNQYITINQKSNGNQIYNKPEVFEYITIYQYSKLGHHHISQSGNFGKSTNEKNGPFSHQYQSAIFH
jgi:hypothetical protein